MALSRPRGFLSKKPSSDLDDPADSSIKIRASAAAGDEIEAEDDDRWSRLLPELLTEIIKRVEESEDRWPSRRTVVACACACKRWRETALEIVRPPLESCRITFPLSLKQPGPREFPMQCFIKWNKKNSTFYLYLCLTRTLVDKGKFLLAARRTRRGGHVEYIISLDANDISQKSNAYVGKLRLEYDVIYHCRETMRK